MHEEKLLKDVAQDTLARGDNDDNMLTDSLDADQVGMSLVR